MVAIGFIDHIWQSVRANNDQPPTGAGAASRVDCSSLEDVERVVWKSDDQFGCIGSSR
jgi:hypothetical protein